MKTYKLLRDMPTVKAGTTFREITREVDGSKILKEYKSSNKVSILVSEVNDFDEWFEEIKEPTDSVHWKPKKDDEYFWMNSYGETQPDVWDGDSIDIMRLALGMIYRTEEECERARERKLAEVRLRKTSTFKPDFKSGKGGWMVYYDHGCETLAVCELDYYDDGEIVRYKTRAEAEKSIKENERDWKIYFGIKEYKWLEIELAA